MRKFVTLVLAAIMLCLLSTEAASARTLLAQRDPSSKYISQIKQKKLEIKEKAKAVKNLSIQIDKKSSKIEELYQILAESNVPKSKDVEKMLEKKDAVVTKEAETLIQIDKNIIRQRKLAATYMKNKNYPQALVSFEKISSLLNNQNQILVKFNSTLEDYIQYLASLQHK